MTTDGSATHALRVDALLRLPDLFTYPGEDFPNRFDAALDSIEAADPALAEQLTPLARLLGSESTESLQELYTRTFDIGAQCTLEIGWHLYGEDYRRGAFLVQMRQMMRAAGVEECGELPDHIVHLLPVLACLSPLKAAPLSCRHVVPAMDKMLDGFSDAANPYRPLVELTRDLLVQTFGPGAPVPGNATLKAGPYENAPSSCPAGSFTFEQEP